MFKSKKGFVLVIALLVILIVFTNGVKTYALPTYLNEKYDNGDVGVHSLLGGKITFEIKSNGTYTYLDWWSSTVPVYIVNVKGGNGTNIYSYAGVYGDSSDLVSPINSSGHPADISHIVFYYLEEPEPTITPKQQKHRFRHQHPNRLQHRHRIRLRLRFRHQHPNRLRLPNHQLLRNRQKHLIRHQLLNQHLTRLPNREEVNKYRR
jgi:hypothetical protein